MNIDEMNLEQVENRLSQIRNELENDGADLDALTEEVRALNARREVLHSADQRRTLRSSIAAGLGTVVGSHQFSGAGQQEQRTFDANSPEYRTAWLKNIAVRSGVQLFGDMTTEERSAFTMTTANSGSVVPTPIFNQIVELVDSMAPIYDDATKTNMTQGFGVARHKGTTQGDAKGVAEGTANEDAQEDFDLLTLEGIEIKKHVVLSRKMKFKSIEAFETWLIQNLAKKIAAAKDGVCIKRLSNEAPDGGSKIANSGIDAGNIVTGKKYTDADIRGIFALLKGTGARVVYANSSTIWNHLAGIVDGDNRKLFVPNSMVDPIVQGRIYGAQVKLDDNLPDNEVYFGIQGAVQANDYDEMEIFSAIEPKTANDIKTAYSLFDAALDNPKSFVKATFTVGG